MAFVGIGENGHLAFNDPPADFETEEPYLVVRLDEACRRQQMGEGWFASLEDVPERAISMSIRQILKSREILCMVPDERKAQAVRDCLELEVSPLHPASILQRHPRTTVYLDRPSAALLPEPGRSGGVRFDRPGAVRVRARRVSRDEALARTTHIGVVAHPDDLEIMAWPAIRDCFGREERWFLGVVATGRRRIGPFRSATPHLSDERDAARCACASKRRRR